MTLKVVPQSIYFRFLSLLTCDGAVSFVFNAHVVETNPRQKVDGQKGDGQKRDGQKRASDKTSVCLNIKQFCVHFSVV